jgi:hypothetical protein
MSDYPYICHWPELGELAGQPCRVVEMKALATTVLVEFPTGERKRVPPATVRRRKPARQEGGAHG